MMSVPKRCAKFMAFDMIIKDSRDKDAIHHDEECILQSIEHLGISCPQLTQLWEVEFYSSPTIYPNRSSVFLSELDLIYAELGTNEARARHSDIPRLRESISRLKNFFDRAVALGSIINTHSD